ncbi:hypothetical protein [Rhodopila sp.]|uniref:hypothetical protein n=1 Tax=Rhodopila sp. TaxID=2480087 RepID=UPI003D0CF1EA
MNAATDIEAAECSIAVFEDARSAFDDYNRWCDKAFQGMHNEHGVEARRRVSQLIWGLRQIKLLLSEAAALRVISHPPMPFISGEAAPDKWFDLMKTPEVVNAAHRELALTEPLQFFTEAFYCFAARTRFIIRQLPKLENFEATGVRNVRNHLLEHPEGKSSGVLITSFGYGGRNGPVVKGLRYDHQVDLWPDPGLFVNAVEFAESLKNRLVLALS